MDRIEGGDVHPILASTVIRINELANAGKLNLVALFTHGRVFDRSLARIIVPPTFFRPSAETGGKAPIWLPDGWRLFADGDQASHIEALRWLMVVSLVLEQDLPEIEPPPRVHHAGVRLGHQLDMPLTARMWECARENRNKATIDRMTQLLGDIGKDPRKARTLRGTVAITFPGREFAVDESPFLDRGVQAFLRELFDRIPYLMYFLSDAPHAAAVLEVYAAYAPNSLIRRPNAAVAATFSEDALAAFAILLHNAGEFALQQGEPREIILGHLNAIPTEIRDLVRQMILRAALLE